MPEETLERLPIPALKDTIERFLERIEPLIENSNHYEKLKKEIYSEGSLRVLNILNDVLVTYDKNLFQKYPLSSYIEKFWYDAYLLCDQSLVLNLNPFFLLNDDPTITPLSVDSVYQEHTLQIKRTARLLQSIVKFIVEVRQGSLSCDFGRNNVKLSMDQYDVLFGSSRSPRKDFYSNLHACNFQTDKLSRHVVIMYKSQFYWFDVLDSKNNSLFSDTQSLELNLYSIIMDFENELHQNRAGSTLSHTPPIGIFTTENRKVWANIRNHMMEKDDETNKLNLKVIDSALFIICLDSVVIEDDNELAKSMLCGNTDINLSFEEKTNSNIPCSSRNNYKQCHENETVGLQKGTCLNRWYDKLQLIVTKNGKAGINFEHTGVDGHTVLRLATNIYTDSILGFAKTITYNVPTIFDSDAKKCQKKTTKCPKSTFEKVENSVIVPRKLKWNLDSFLTSSLHFAETRLSDLISQHDLETLNFNGYGSSHIKSKFACSPDAFCQQVFQVAYYALYGKFETVYEPAMTKSFQNGRTEAIRSITNESKNFVKSLFDKNSKDDIRIQLLHEACKKHSKISAECSRGLGQDRHLYALYCIFNENFKDQFEVPAIFNNEGWSLLNRNVMSTSNCGNSCLNFFGFGPVTTNGFGIGYIIKSNSVSIVVASRHRQTKRFISLIARSFSEINNIFLREQVAKTSKSLEASSINSSDEYLVGMRSSIGRKGDKSKDLTYLLSGYDYFDVST